jgi:P-type Ca2+ transporter type 2C
LDEAAVLQRLAQFGPNRLAEAKQQTVWQVFLEEIREPMILLILLEAGRRVPADARLLESYSLAADEASLTVESVPVEKDAHQLYPAKISLAERSNMLYAGTTVTRGRGAAIVVATGMHTELGQVVGIVREIKQPRTLLQQTMRELSFVLVWVALGFSMLVPLLGVLLAGEPLRLMLLTGLSLPSPLFLRNCRLLSQWS